MIFIDTFLVEEGHRGSTETFDKVITIGEEFIEKDLNGITPEVLPEKQLFETCPVTESRYPAKPSYRIGNCLVSVREGTGFFDRNRTIQFGVASESQEETNKLIEELFDHINSKVYRHDVCPVKKTSLDVPEISFQNMLVEDPYFEKFIEFSKSAVVL